MSENNNNNNNKNNTTFLEALNKKLREEGKTINKSLPEAYLQIQKYKEEIDSLSSSPFEGYKKLKEEDVCIRASGSIVRGFTIRYFLKERVQLACIINMYLLRDTILGHGAVFFIEVYTQKLWFWTKNFFNALDEFGKADYLLQSTENDKYEFSNLDEFYKSDLFKKNIFGLVYNIDKGDGRSNRGFIGSAVYKDDFETVKNIFNKEFEG